MLIDLATLPETASEYFLTLGGRTEGLKISKKKCNQTADSFLHTPKTRFSEHGCQTTFV